MQKLAQTDDTLAPGSHTFQPNGEKTPWGMDAQGSQPYLQNAETASQKFIK